MHQRSAVSGRLWIHDRGQRPQVDRDQLGGIDRLLAALRHQHGHGLSLVAGPVAGQQRPLRKAAPAGSADREGGPAFEVGGGEHAQDARRLTCRAGLERGDLGVGHVAAHEDQVGGAG